MREVKSLVSCCGFTMTRDVRSDLLFFSGALYVLFLEADHENPIRNYTKIMMPESEGARFGTSLTNTFDVDGNGGNRVGGEWDGEG